ncbi:hypothetical protein RsTz2092_13320 [Deferribacterales bacterium RsTz2092]
MKRYVRFLFISLLIIFSGCAFNHNKLSLNYDGQHEGIGVSQDFYVKASYNRISPILVGYYYEDLSKCLLYDNRVFKVEIDDTYRIDTDNVYLTLSKGSKIPAKLLSVKRVNGKQVFEYYLPVMLDDLVDAHFIIADVYKDNSKTQPFVVTMKQLKKGWRQRKGLSFC